ncbi:RICIN domain-containing protein [Nonomuraea bangladeshensis]|uniref:pectate lyase family protein n=1 Tax=Nonomuraea bangladeshensis TaxID=404385 RepID=UPI003C2DD085
MRHTSIGRTGAVLTGVVTLTASAVTGVVMASAAAAAPAPGAYTLVNAHSGKCAGVEGASTSAGKAAQQESCAGGSSPTWTVAESGGTVRIANANGSAPNDLVGWATQGGGTTGGGGTSPITVTSSSALTSALSASGSGVIRVSGTISCSGMLKVGSNKTIIGNSGAVISGCGLNISKASNVIVRNLTFRNWNDDAINVQYSTRVWIDHNSFSNGYDGAVDVKRASDYVTISWNRVSSHDKTMLLGHDDGNGSEDRGHLRVTYHHNWFDGTNQRHPRVRFGNPVHVYNNFYGNIGSYGVASTQEAGVLVEGNYFENTDDPFHRGEGDSGPGNLVARNNCFVNSGSGQAGGSVASIPYSYTLDTPCNVKSIVTAGAGAGRISV